MAAPNKLTITYKGSPKKGEMNSGTGAKDFVLQIQFYCGHKVDVIVIREIIIASLGNAFLSALSTFNEPFLTSSIRSIFVFATAQKKA